ncbi:MAG: hypothetical protein AB7K24_19715 [Gemmataceae bacterium]
MFGFFKKHPEPDLPTDKQRRYAAKLGIEIPPSMTKDELSQAIAAVERRNPALGEKREQIVSKAREKRFDKDLTEQEGRWNRFADEIGYMLAIFTRGKEKIVDVLRVNQAFIDGRGKLRLGVESPKVVKDRDIGDFLDWDKEFELPIGSLLFHEPLHAEFHAQGNEAYAQVVKRGLKIASEL